MVEVLDPLNPRKDQDQNGDCKTSSTCSAPTITLEVPGFSFGKCLSPIKELPSPMPTPIPSPIPFQRAKSSQEELSSSSSSSGKSSSSKKAAASLLNNRRSSFTSLCKKAAANAGGKRRSSTNSIIKSSMSTSDEDMIPMQEIKVPIIVTSSNIPLITLTEPDDEPFDEEDEEPEEEEEVEIPEIAVSPPSPRPSRKDFKVPEIQEDLETAQDQVPMIQITIDSPSSTEPLSSSSSPSTALMNSKPVKFKPPPIVIPNSNFLNFENQEEEEVQNVPKDAMSKPEESIRIIELGERRTKTPNAEQQSETSIKVRAHFFLSSIVFYFSSQIILTFFCLLPYHLIKKKVPHIRCIVVTPHKQSNCVFSLLISKVGSCKLLLFCTCLVVEKL